MNKPREKLLRLGVKSLSLEELWAVVFGHGTKYLSVFELAQKLQQAYGDVPKYLNLPAERLASELGLGIVTTQRLLACLELGRRYFGALESGERPTVVTSLQAYNILKDMENYDREVVRGLYLDCRGNVIADQLLSIGSLTMSIAHPREVFKPAVTCSAAGVLIAHNHPSGTLLPSEEDQNLTALLIEAGNIMQIPLFDHIIVGRRGYYSFRDLQPEMFET